MTNGDQTMDGTNINVFIAAAAPAAGADCVPLSPSTPHRRSLRRRMPNRLSKTHSTLTAIGRP